MPNLCVEYAKSGRSKCTGCKKAILKHELRLGIENQFPGGDEPIISWQWRHLCCFTERQIKNAENAGTLSEIAGYDDLPADAKVLVDDMKVGKLVGHTDLIGKVNDNAGDQKNPSETRKRTKAPAAKAPPKRARKTETVDGSGIQQDEGTEDFDVEVVNSDAPPCPYGDSCFQTQPEHHKQFSHGKGPRPVLKK